MCTIGDLHRVPQQHRIINKGPIPLVRWQIDYIGPLPVSEGYQYAMTCVYTAIGLMVAFLPVVKTSRQPKEAWSIFAAYGQPQVTESDQGTHFTGHTLQEWL